MYSMPENIRKNIINKIESFHKRSSLILAEDVDM